MAPGMLCDLFVLRQRYDDEQHGLERRKEQIDYDEGDFAPIIDDDAEEG